MRLNVGNNFALSIDLWYKWSDFQNNVYVVRKEMLIYITM